MKKISSLLSFFIFTFLFSTFLLAEDLPNNQTKLSYACKAENVFTESAESRGSNYKEACDKAIKKCNWIDPHGAKCYVVRWWRIYN